MGRQQYFGIYITKTHSFGYVKVDFSGYQMMENDGVKNGTKQFSFMI